MTQVHPLARPVAPVFSLPGRRAVRTLHLPGRSAVVPTPPAHGTPPASVLPPEVAALVAQAQITLAGSLALLQSGATVHAVHQATGRAIRAATLLKRACGALAQGAAA